MVDWISVAVYFIIFFVIPINFYLKKTGKTFKEMIDDIIEFFRSFSE